MADSITRQEWQALQEKINRIEIAIIGGIEGVSGGLRGRVDGLEREIHHCKENMTHEVSAVREQVAALEESRRWIVRLVSGAVITTVISALVAVMQMVGKH
jgi:hypothetical protein